MEGTEDGWSKASGRLFAKWAKRNGHGGEFRIRGRVAEGSYLDDLHMMTSVARGTRRLRFPPADGFVVTTGITFDYEINGLAEKAGDVHYSSITLGHCLAAVYAAEAAFSTGVTPDIGYASPTRSASILPSATLLRDPEALAASMLALRTPDPVRRAASRFVGHLIFVFVFFHEYFHCTLGHCLILHEAGSAPRLREFGDGSPALDVGDYLGFELMADSHAANGVFDSVRSKVDLPTRLGLVAASGANRDRLAVLAIALLIALWHELDRGAPTDDRLHPPPAARLLSVVDQCFLSAREYKGETYASDLVGTLMRDLKVSAASIPEVDRAFKSFIALDARTILNELIALKTRPNPVRFRPL